ncbi:MAG: hypothetical protein JJT96_12175 [Opitutales bacterium]|nr:hypothetical protein [Opitutales bacterium]
MPRRFRLLRLPGALIALALFFASAASSLADVSLPLDERSLWELDFPVKEQHRLAALIERGVLDIAMVAQAPLSDTHTHLGWPVATQLPSGRIVVVFRQRDGHNGSDEGDRWVIYTDDLETWHPTGVITNKELRLGESSGMYAVDWAPRPDNGEPRLVILNGDTDFPEKRFRAYLSEDEGVTWTETAPFSANLLHAQNTGPRMARHPVFGLVGALGQGINRENFLVRTLDAGLTWEERIWINSEDTRPREPALATWGPGHMIMLSREYTEFGYGGDPTRKYFYLTQHVYAYDEGDSFQDVNFTTVSSNIAGNGATTSEPLGRSSQDTADVYFNPVTGRMEMLQSHRWGTGGYEPEHTLAETLQEERSSLNIWSIDPDDLLAGSSTWRFDGTLIERIGNARPGHKDGLHPGGSVLDFARGQQHIFVYAGWRRGPASIYRISRTLDTAQWLAAVAEVDEELADFVEPAPSIPAIYWTGEGNRYGGQTNAWSSFAYDHPDFPVYGLATTNGVSTGEIWNFHYDLTGMSGLTTTVRMNRNEVTMASLTLTGVGSSGFTFTNVDNTGSGHMLAGQVNVTAGAHFFQAPTPGRTIELMTDSTWSIAEGAILRFDHVLSGPYDLVKAGHGTLLITGNQLHTGDTLVDRGVFGLGNGPGSLAGDLSFAPGGRLRFNPVHTLGVMGEVSFEGAFGIGDIDGLDASVPLGTYGLISGTIDTANLKNIGLTRAAPIGPDRWAYFGVNGGLTVTVVDAVPEPPSLSLQWIGFDANRPVLELDGPAGATFTIETSTNLLNWTDLDFLNPAETPVQWMDPAPLNGDPRFYRMRLGAGEDGD